jgi:nitrogen fixation/metabolism regulation signal transduction histidine kinase
MEIVYFSLGIITVLLVLGVVVIVRVGTLVNELKEKVRDLEQGTLDVAVDIHRRIDDVDRELNSKISSAEKQIDVVEENLHRRIDDVDRELNSKIDSRLDKLQSKINQKDLLKG